MPDTLGPINITLSDYNFQRDIENRLLMSHLSVFDVEVLREILDGSLKNSVKQIAKTLGVSEKELLPVLDKLSVNKLFQRQGDAIIVDKEMRKYYESQILKFDDDFEPDMDFLQGLLSKVPIHALPNWYSVPRMTNNIFASIVDNYLLNPKVYERYLSQLKFKDPILTSIMKDVFTAPDFQIFAHDIMKKYDLSREEFEEHMLELEFSFVCCLGYNRVDDVWEEVVTPFHEWRTYLRFLRDTLPKEIKKGVQRVHPHDFGFVEDLSAILRTAQHEVVKLKDNFLSMEDAAEILPHLDEVYEADIYVAQLTNALIEFPLAIVKGNQLRALPEADKWLHKSSHAQSAEMSRYAFNCLRKKLDESSYTERDIREVERSLRRVARSGWIYFDDFIAGMISSIGSAESVVLQNKGKRWRYVLPTYTDDDRAFVQQVLCDTMSVCGYVALGIHDERLCFYVTPHGRMAIGE